MNIPSRHLEAYPYGPGRWLIYNRLWPSPVLVSADVLKLLDILGENPDAANGCEGSISYLGRLREHSIVFEDAEAEASRLADQHRRWLDEAGRGGTLRTLILNVDTRCNMRCTYCNVRKFREMHRMPPAGPMHAETAERSVSGFAEILKMNGNRGRLVFFGGEPLMNENLVFDTARWVREKGWDHLDLSVNTNGVLLTREKIRRLKELGCAIALSLDGLAETNDRFRKDAHGNGTFAILDWAVRTIVDEGCPLVVLTTLQSASFEELDRFQAYLAATGVINWSVKLPTFEKRDSDIYTSSHVSQWAEAMVRVFGRANEDGMSVTGIPGQKFTGCEGVGRMASVEPDGTVFPCPGGIPVKLGGCDDLLSIVESPAFLQVCERTLAMLPECRSCPAAGMCAGSCPADAMHMTGKYLGHNPLICRFMRELVRLSLLHASPAPRAPEGGQ